jgi:hypothetical protein
MSVVNESARGTQASGTARRALSADGSWWWNGQRWVAAVTEDGLWRWDGVRWTQTVDLEGKRPEDLATTLTMLAERCYAEAGVILAQRAAEWEPEASMQELVRDTREVGRRLGQLNEELTSQESTGNRGLLGRRAPSDDDRRYMERERDELKKKHWVLTVKLGRNAPRPSLKEADDRLVSARLLEQRASLLTAGLAEVDEAERMRADAAVAAQKQLSAAEGARAKALENARKAVDAAERAHASAVAEARLALRSVLSPGAGELKGGVGPLRLHTTLLETPHGRIPAAGCTAVAGTASALWRQHREVLHDLVLLESPEGEAFREALSESKDGLFLLIRSRTASVLWPCPAGQEKGAERFAAMISDHAKQAEQDTAERDAIARKSEQNLDAVIRDRSKIQAAEAELARVEADGNLLGAIDEARQRLDRARADTPELTQARRKVMELARRVVASPEPLKEATALS